ncbi:MAG TPA: hypothetical protein VFH47_09225, partial [Candidatus Thermoplasmatota archaeon]|nr:hypothetical protein [Candidatus Thermoplasmatota archaeon]
MDVQYAQSAVLTPSDFTFPRDGIAAEANPNVEMVVLADLDLELLRRQRRLGSVRQLQDRRKDLYQLTVHEPAQAPPPPDASVPAGGIGRGAPHG